MIWIIVSCKIFAVYVYIRWEGIECLVSACVEGVLSVQRKGGTTQRAITNQSDNLASHFDRCRIKPRSLMLAKKITGLAVRS